MKSFSVNISMMSMNTVNKPGQQITKLEPLNRKVLEDDDDDIESIVM